MTDPLSERVEKSLRSLERWSCVCKFARSLNERDPYAFPRVGLETNVIYRCQLIIQHEKTGVYALQPETKACCPEWFKEEAND